jgi:hypothetical protein
MNNSEDSFEATRREFTQRLFEAYNENNQLGYWLDKSLLSLSGGSLVFSMTFVSAFAPGRHWLVILFLAWVCFGGSIACVIVAMRKAQTATTARAVEISDRLGELEKRKAPDVTITSTLTMSRNVARIRLNTYALGAFLVGLVCLAIFVGINLWWARQPLGQPDF